MAAILSFTAEEVWQAMPERTVESVFLDAWHTIPSAAAENVPQVATDSFWSFILEVREQVARELEKARVAGAIGSSLDAEVDLYCAPELYAKLAELKDELRFVLITSYARIHRLQDATADAVGSGMEGLKIQVTVSAHGKCVRCWHHRADVGSSAEHPRLCGRCIENVTGTGESRYYA